jgi:asparagine synthase (glutamine-hydrolysing)
MQQAMASWQPDSTNIYTRNDAVLGCLLLHTTEESIHETLPYTDEEAQLTITADARIDNRHELSSVLGLKDDVMTPDSLYILKAYRKWGHNCCKHLLGDYAFAIWNSRERELYCARDHIGARALFYHAGSENFIFATSPRGIIASGGILVQLQDDWIANILAGVYPRKDMSPFAHTAKLPPAHYLAVTPGSFNLRQYWDLDTSREIHYRQEQDYYEEMRALLEQAIRACTRSAFPVGAELSGGLDSSGIAAIAHRELKKRNREAATFSHVMPAWAKDKIYPFDDERIFIDSLCSYAGITQKHYITAEGKGIVDEFLLCNERFGYPTGYHFPIFCDALYEKAQKEGIRVLLSGFPGDELVTSHGAELYNEFYARHRYRLVWRDLYQRHAGRQYFKAWYLFGAKTLMHYTPGLAHLLRGRPGPEANWRDNSFGCTVTTDDYAEKMCLRERIYNTTTYPVFNDVRIRERARITEAFVCHRLEQSAAHAAFYRLEYRNPLADRRLLEYVLALPAEIKVRNGYQRYPYRMAVAGILPENLQWRTTKTGATIPTVSLRLLKDSGRMDDILLHASENNCFPPYIDMSKMKCIKHRLDNKQLKDAVYPHSFYSALMLLSGKP